jgi:hypothetical protein
MKTLVVIKYVSQDIPFNDDISYIKIEYRKNYGLLDDTFKYLHVFHFICKVIEMPKIENFQKFVYLDKPKKKILLLALGYDIDQKGFVVWADTKKTVFCKYTRRPVHINEASVLPGSCLVINTTPTSMSQYIEEYLE